MDHLWPLFFVCKGTSPTSISTLSLHDALPISGREHRPSVVERGARPRIDAGVVRVEAVAHLRQVGAWRSEEHTSELQSHHDLVCRLLLEKKNIRPPKLGVIPPAIHI